jgi:hypothetical protein
VHGHYEFYAILVWLKDPHDNVFILLSELEILTILSNRLLSSLQHRWNGAIEAYIKRAVGDHTMIFRIYSVTIGSIP